MSEQQHAVTRVHITTAMQDLKTSQHMKDQKHHSQQQRERFIASLAYDEINARHNDISENHRATFEWMFDKDLEPTRDAFQVWLKDEEAVFWINGKAGSGKSTLMKFLANHSKTRQLLTQWSSKNQVIIVSYFFWLAGNGMQKSLKGLLCSLVYQVLQGDSTILDRISLSDSKRYISDWSEAELQDLLRRVFENLSCSICMFLDGLDEFDEADDIERLLDLLEKLAANKGLKLCVSSRPEIAIEKRLSRYKHVQLHDLTLDDMERYIRDNLRKSHDRYTSIDAEEMQNIVKAMTQKADGVFLWVHYVLSSVLRGVRNADDPSVVLQRIEELPSGMRELYNQMWKRLNGDEQRYRDEAAQLFSYVSDFNLSVFEMLVIFDTKLQDGYRQGFTRNDSADLAGSCERLKTRIRARCAGLLEFKIGEGKHESFAPYPSINDTSSSEANETLSSTFEAIETQKWISDPKEQIDEGRKANSPLMIQGQTNIQFLHRTARDYVMDTKEGRTLLGERVFTFESTSHDVAVARLATVSQGLEAMNEESVSLIIQNVAESDCKQKSQLLQTFRRICERRSVPRCPHQHIGYVAFWKSTVFMTFEGGATFYGCVDYVQEYVEKHGMDVNPFHRGIYLFIAFSAFLNFGRLRAFPLIIWLASNGADMMSSISFYSDMTNLASRILGIVISEYYHRPPHPELSGLLRQMLESLRPLVVSSAGQCEVWLGSDETEESFDKKGWFLQMGPLCLYTLAMRSVTRTLPNSVHPEQVVSSHKLCRTPRAGICSVGEKAHHEWEVKVLYFYQGRNSGLFPCAEDSVCLGQALEGVLPEDDISSRMEFETCLAETLRRSTTLEVREWEFQTGRVRHHPIGTPSAEKARIDIPAENSDGSSPSGAGRFVPLFPDPNE